MAYTKRHAIKATLNKSIRYIQDTEKTEQGTLIYGLNCSIDPLLAIKQMNFTKHQFAKEDGILAFHFVQSFKPNEVTDYNIVHQIGIEFAKRITNNKYEAVVTTHTDKEHLHNHIIFNSVSYVDGEKYNSCKEELKKIRLISDEVCKEFNLSVIQTKGRGKKYKEWYENKKGTSWKTAIKEDVDKTIDKVKSFEEFIQVLNEKGYEIKFGDNIKHIAFKLPGQQRFTRGRTIGIEYTEEAIKKRIIEKEFGIEVVQYRNKNKKAWVDWDVYRYKSRKGSLINNISITGCIIKNLLDIGGEKKFKNKFKILNQKHAEDDLRELENTLLFIDKNGIEDKEQVKDIISDLNKKNKILEDYLKKIDKFFNRFSQINMYRNQVKLNQEIYMQYKNSPIKSLWKLKNKDKISKISEFENAELMLVKYKIKNDKDYMKLKIKVDELLEDKLKCINEIKRNEVSKNKYEKVICTINKVYENKYVQMKQSKNLMEK